MKLAIITLALALGACTTPGGLVPGDAPEPSTESVS